MRTPPEAKFRMLKMNFYLILLAATCGLMSNVSAQVCSETKFENLEALNRLAKDNVSVKVDVLEAGRRQEKNRSFKNLRVSLEPVGAKPLPCLVQLFVTTKNDKQSLMHFCWENTALEGVGSFEFSTDIKGRKYDGKYSLSLDYQLRTGASILGWFVRVVRDNRVIGTAGSNPAMVILAEKPKLVLAEFKPEQLSRR